MYKLEEDKRYYCDFHCHSNRSDGRVTRKELIQRVIEENEGDTMILGISDHNIAFDDLDELQKEFDAKIVLVPACEVSASYVVPGTGRKLEVHINAIDYQLNHSDFLDMLKKNQHDKREYVEKILTKLSDVGVHVVDTYEELVEYAYPSNHIGRMVIARMMVQKGLVKTVDEAFDRYFGSYGDRTCYVDNPFEYVSLEEVVLTIRKVGGIPVLCHPYYYNLQNEDLMELIRFFKELGGLAIETEYSIYSETQRAHLRKVADSFGLGISAGSDYHGNEGEFLNHNFPGWIYEELMKLKEND